MGTNEGHSEAGPGAAETPELAMQGLALARAASGLAHQVRNPLNAMALQVALLTEKIAADAGLAATCAGTLAKLREQIGRVDGAVRAYLDAADRPSGSTCAPARLMAEGVALFEHEARRRQVTLEAEPALAALEARGDPIRVGRMWMGLLWRALEETGSGGWVRLRCRRDGDEVILAVEWRAAAGQPGTPWIPAAVAESAPAVGGRLEQWQREGAAGAALRLRAEGR
ncbi:MAG: HAMP domain-containing histidine kinase [Deltaproteobacteria bacterium]|nr:HAMP domain-containing histidine kinase [Deltaproteobacteria bacterium]